ncbi:MAG: baseplate J/gp47 family protein [Gammaproteobacteria bacterium]|nr:baseplate J/gp47 family protein [Gammaproteobacteria bacterium]
MSDDLTRWNRAGRSRFEYVDGNAVLWLERLREALHERFPHSGVFAAEAPSDETVSERLRRLETRYRAQQRGDLLWETTRAFARACHVLTEHLDAYANEGYLRTATQWENVRRLVEMIDYHPAPPASAATTLVLEAKSEASGEIVAGFQVKYTPAAGGAPVIFETLHAIEVDAALNALHLAGWNRSAASLSQAGVDVWVADRDIDGLSAGQIALLVRAGSAPAAAVVELGTLHPDSRVLGFSLLDGQPATSGWPLADVRLQMLPAQIMPVLPTDARTLRLDVDHGLVAGDVISWHSGGSWRFDRVQSVDTQSVRLSFADNMPAPGTDIFKAAAIERPSGEFLFAIDDPTRRVAQRTASGFELLRSGAAGSYTLAASGEHGSYYRVTDDSIVTLYAAPEDTSRTTPVGTTLAVSAQAYELAGGPGKLGSGQWIAAQREDGEWRALRIARILEQEDRFFLELEQTSPARTPLVRLVGAFAEHLTPRGANENLSPLSEQQRTALPVAMPASSSARALLAVGRPLLVEQASGKTFTAGVVATITRVESTRIWIDPPLPASAGFTRGNTVVRANVVRAGHGERQPERVLGSGDATRANQSFEFANPGVSFVADATMSSGVAADISIQVSGQRWTQVSTLNDSRGTDAHYTVRMTEQGHLTIGFGDGEHGRRLPTGTGNVRIGWRKGSGLHGNVEAGGLSKPVKPHRLIDTVRQPLDASGGADMESAASLRDNAPATLLTLDRAVSITDFQNLAVAHSSVWQANAFSVAATTSRENGIEVVVVPSGGGELGALADTLRLHLQNHALPGVSVTVSDHEPVLVSLGITVRIRSEAFVPDDVVAAVAASLLDAFALARRKLGQPLYLAELFQRVESVTGVENCDCNITDLDESRTHDPVRRLEASGIVKGLVPGPRQVIHVAGDGSGIVIQWQEHTL